ncbi:MAG: DUF86 domain-containing protein [Chloroflexi bacterium]|nr:DUF86 domain-containing protein [Chloroflexota bacterium]MBP7042027.1 DUF86 domain-containing protein [Chloroflexota bacterium]
MVKRQIIHKRLQKLDEYLAILQEAQKYSYEAFIASPERYGSVERFLQLALEVLIDLGNHIVADDELGEVGYQRDIPALLAENGYISPELREKWFQMIGFRNILVHDYAEIDHQIVYDVLQNQLADFLALRAVFAQFL